MEQIQKAFKKGFDSEPLYDVKFIKTKIKISNNRVYRNFQNNKIT